MTNKLFNQVSGMIAVSLKGRNTERVINMALARGIYLWDIRRTPEGIECKVRNSAYEALQSIATEHNYDIAVLERQGLPFYKNLLKKRMGFVSGALIFILALYLMSSFVWFVDISGNHNVSKNRLLLTAAKYGVYQGAAKWNFSRTEVEKSILRDIGELAYVELDITGVRARIKVVEKIFPRSEITGPCHIVARTGGVVEDVLVLEGQASVRPGSIVARGDILISGIIFPEIKTAEAGETDNNNEAYEVRARGTVKARVWYEGYGECRVRTETKVFTGRKRTVVYLETPWRTFMLRGGRSYDYSHYAKKVRREVVNTPAGKFSLCRLQMQEQKIKAAEYSEPDAVDIARDRAMQVLNRKLGEAQKITDSRVDILSSPSDPILRVKVSVETIEDIAVAQPIQSGRNGN